MSLARKPLLKEIISEVTYKRVIDSACWDTYEDRFENILDDIKGHVCHNPGILTAFVNILRDLSRQDLADVIMSKYKGIIHYEYK